MSFFVQISDFKGQTEIAKDVYTKEDLQTYIDKFEVYYLQELLGCELYKEFYDDFALTGIAPTNPKFALIWEALCVDYNCGILRSDGIRQLLVGFIYFEYVRDQNIKNNIAGNNKNVQANSEAAITSSTNLITVYNSSVNSSDAIQHVICDNKEGYDWAKYNGQQQFIIGYF